MIQLYFLSILCNGLSGYVLFTGEEEETIEKSMKFSMNSPVFHLVLGILSAVTGVLKLLSPFENRIPILGDLVPSLAGVVAGIILVFGVYRHNSSSDAETLDRLGVALLRFRKPIGVGLLLVSLLHFLFPQALFL
ncbi:MAG: hypothetical protein LBH44_06900 [Treponema sp.]|jgi:hypothetical protein|nr:hypothetical protein [Treponema sp.]